MPRLLSNDSAGIKDLAYVLWGDFIASGFCFILNDNFLSFSP